MAGTALTTVLDTPVPAHIAARMAAEGSGNITARANVNALTFEGKVWSINLDGKKTKLMRTNQDGEEEPVSIFTGIVLDYNRDRGREWYAKPYDPKNPTIPDCWSEDSKTPHENVPQKVAKTCAACPNAKKGSANTQDGNPTVACGQFQKIAVIPAAKIGAFPPLRLRLKITSIYDKSGIDKHPGWHAWQQYLDHLVAKGVNNTHYIPTKIKFDPAVAYPKLLFATGKDWLDDDTLSVVEGIAASDVTRDLLASTYDPSASNTGNKPLPEDDGEETEVVAAAQPAQARAKPAGTKPKPAPAPASAPEPEEEPEEPVTVAGGDEEEAEEEVVQPVTRAPAKPAAAANASAAAAAQARAAGKAAQARQAAPAAEEAEEEEATAVPPPKPAKAAAGKPNGKAAPAAKPTLQAPAEVADLMQDWDD